MIPLTFQNKIINITELLTMVSIPDFQRVKDDYHVDEIFAYNETCYEQIKTFNIFGSISLGKTKCDTKYIILDGQHRLNAYQKLYNKYGNFEVSIDLYIKTSGCPATRCR